MGDYKFYIKPVTRGNDGVFTIGDILDLEADFPGLRYKSMTGMGAYGKPRVYSEIYPESDKADVYMLQSDPRDPFKAVLTLYFFDPDNHSDYPSAIAGADKPYRDFMDAISGRFVIYFDTARRRKAFLYLDESTEPKNDILKGGTPYKEVQFSFSSVYGRTFPAYTKDGVLETEDLTLENGLNQET